MTRHCPWSSIPCLSIQPISAGLEQIQDRISPLTASGAAYISGQTFFGFSRPESDSTDQKFARRICAEDQSGRRCDCFRCLIGGDGGDIAATVSVDPGGNIYLAGSTSSTNFPLQNPLQTSRRGIQDAFAAKIDASGSTLLFSTYLGGEGIDSASSLAVAAMEISTWPAARIQAISRL